MTALAVEGLRVAAPDGTALLRGVSLAVAPGVPLSLLGETGSGKTLVAEAAMGTLAPELRASGRVVVEGAASDAGDRGARRALWGRRLALLPQEPWSALDPTMRAGPQVAEGHRFVRGLSARQARARAAADLVALGLGGAGGIVNMSYQLNEAVHNTQWVTGHFHLIFGGAIVIMYFTIAYDLWPQLTRSPPLSARLMRIQLWLWFIGIMVTTLPWHWLGLEGQWRRVAHFNYRDPVMAWWGPWVTVSFVGGLVMLASAVLFVTNLAGLHRSERAAPGPMRYALAVHPPKRVPAVLNGFELWNAIVLMLMLATYGYPIAQFFISPPPQAAAHSSR